MSFSLKFEIYTSPAWSRSLVKKQMEKYKVQISQIGIIKWWYETLQITVRYDEDKEEILF